MEKLEQSIHILDKKLVVLGGASKRRVLAAIEYIKQHPEVKTVVFTGGRTGGPDKPSEAEDMKNYFERKYPNQEIKFILESESCDTEDNAEKTVGLLRELFSGNVKEILLLSDTTHLPRAGWAFKRRGIKAQGIMSEYWIARRSKHHRTYLRKLVVSTRFLKQTLVIEPLLHTLTLFEKGRSFIRSKTKGRL